MECELHIGKKMSIEAIGRSILRNSSHSVQCVVFTHSYYDVNDAVIALRNAVLAVKGEFGEGIEIGRFNRDGKCFKVCVNDFETSVTAILGINPVENANVAHIWKTDMMGAVPLEEFVQSCKVDKFCLYHGIDNVGVNQIPFADVKAFYYPTEMKMDEIEGDVGICDKCTRRMRFSRSEMFSSRELSAEVGVYCCDKEEEKTQMFGGKIIISSEIQCARQTQDGSKRHLYVGRNCPYYVEHFLWSANQ